MDSIARELIGLGLSEKETAVYLALLEIGPASVQDIAAKAGVNRATTYLLIDSLTDKGLAGTTTVGNKQSYLAAPPEQLVTLLRLRRKELEEREANLSKAIPFLEAIHNSRKEKPRIRYFEGLDGIRTVRGIFTELEGDYVQIVPLDDIRDSSERIEPHSEHFQRLESQGARMRGIIVMDEPDAARLPPVPGAEVRVIAKSEFPIQAELTIRGNTVFLFSFRKDMLSVVIESPEFANTLRTVFELAWRSTEVSDPEK